MCQHRESAYRKNTMVSGIKFSSYNVNGLLNPVKRNKILSKLKKEKVEIAMLQETHLDPSEHEKLRRMGFSKVYFSSYKSGHRRGVATLISKNIPFELISESKDKEGRFSLISGKINGVNITLLNVYAPPGSDFIFYGKVFEFMTQATGVCICGGDWNIRLNSKLDTSKPVSQNSLQKKIKVLMSDQGIIDTWRDLYPTSRDYTHYSHSHTVYSRIDYFFIFKKDRHRIQTADIGNIDLSDHAPIYLTLDINNEPRNTLWKLNTNVLNDLQFITLIKSDITTFLEENLNGEVSLEIVWDALKACMRGKIISFCSHKKKERQSKLQELNKELKELETKHKRNLNSELEKKLKVLRNKINAMYQLEIRKKMIYTKQKYYESGSKFTKLLASKLKKQQADNTIYKIKDPISKTCVYKQSEIQHIFQNYYKQLYTQPNLENEQKIKTFLEQLKLPTLSEKQNKILMAEITERELSGAISKLKANKSPGPDGFPAEWYKKLKTELLPFLLRILNLALKNGKMPSSWKQATISVIPKAGKDPLSCSSFRPISVLNIDYKLFTSIMAKRLEVLLPELINTDQTGFISQRQTHDNIRRTLHIINHIKKQKRKAALVSLDAEKAFDSVSWSFLYKVLERFGFHRNFINTIETLYTKPTARIKINGHLTDTIELARGTRQGCGLSPLLFSLYIEPLAQMIRETEDITGIAISGDVHKVALYADDVLIYLSEPTKSLPILFNCLNNFGSYAGYKLNVNKTQIITFNYDPPINVRQALNLKWNLTSLKYLGVVIPTEINTIAKCNYDDLTAKIKQDIQRWTAIPFMSLTQRIESIKMNILPRFLFLFQAIPAEITTKQFQEWEKMISRFIWLGKKPRVRFKTLQLCKENGGMAVPSLKDYFYSAQIKPLMNLCNPKYQARWKDIELHIMSDPPLQAILGNEDFRVIFKQVENPWLELTLKSWSNAKNEYNLHDNLKILRWCAYDPDFKPNKMDNRFRSWIPRGITTYYSLTDKGVIKDFQTLKNSHNLEKQDFYRYMQLRHYITQKIHFPLDVQEPVLNEILNSYNAKSKKGVISRLYKGFLNKKLYSTHYITIKWEKEANVTLTDEEWRGCCTSVWKCTNSHLWKEFSWKCLIRFFITPKQKARWRGEEPKCWRQCGNQDANHWHIFWGCSIINQFWKDIHKNMESIFNTTLAFDFKAFIIGKIEIHQDNKYLYTILTTAGKKALTRQWLLPEPPTLDQWINIVNDIYQMERLTFSLRLQMSKFSKLWAKWIMFINAKHTQYAECFNV